jgi:hypothetical protein
MFWRNFPERSRNFFVVAKTGKKRAQTALAELFDIFDAGLK